MFFYQFEMYSIQGHVAYWAILAELVQSKKTIGFNRLRLK